MNGYPAKGCSNLHKKSLSDSEHTREYHNNRSTREESPPTIIIPSYCSEESMPQNRTDVFTSNSTTFCHNNFPDKNPPRKIQFTSIDHLDVVPKAFIERSFRPHPPEIIDKKKHLAELIAQIESDHSDASNHLNETKTSTNETKSFAFDDCGIKNKPIETILENQPFIEASPHIPVAAKRQQPVESYVSEDSNFSAMVDELSNSYPQFHAPYYYQVPPSFSNTKSSSYSFEPPCVYPYNSSSDYSMVDTFNTEFMFSGSHSAYPIAPYGEIDISSQPPVEQIRPFKKHIPDQKITKKLSKPVDVLVSKFDETDFSKTCQPSKDVPFFQDRDYGTVEMAKDQHGSRLIQQKIEAASPDELSHMIEELAHDEKALVILVGDVFGNYVIQKLLDFGNNEHRITLVNKISGNILHLAVQMYGCRVVQKAIECGSPEIQRVIIQEISGHVLDCIKDQNGNHVIQKCIERIDSVMLSFVIREISGRVVELSTHPYGCRVIQRILERFDDNQKLCITEELFNEIPSLVLDQYGNYVVQHILDHCNNSSHRDYVFHYVRTNLFLLSSHKFASNVVEKCLVSGSRSERRVLMGEIIDNSIGTEEDVVFKMMKDAYANYVIQKMIDVIIADREHDLFNELVSKIRPHYPSLRKISYGKHIINKIDKICAKISTRATLFPRLQGEYNPTTGKHFHIYHENGICKAKEPKVSPKSSDKKHVICDNLIEFPSLLGEDTGSLSE